MSIIDTLFKLQDKKYLNFQSKLVPTISKESIIGVRIPKLRILAKEYMKDKNYLDFLNNLPHKYYDENILHSIIISEIKDFDLCINLLEKFIPYIDNWAACDVLSPKIFIKHKDILITRIKKWITSDETYTIRFGLKMLMQHYLDADFNSSYLKISSSINSKEYYVNMMIAWLFATALAKQWNWTIPYIENKTLSNWVHNKIIQKACESFRISDKQKEYLRGFKIYQNLNK